MRKRIIGWATVLILLIPMPGMAHSRAELDQLAAQLEVGVTPELLAEWADLMDRHRWYLEPPAVRSTASSVTRVDGVYRGMGQNVEQWRPLVAAHFPADDVDIALRVMGCESGGNPNAKNPNSSASGLFQMLKMWWNGEWYFDPFDPEQNVIHAAKLWGNGSGISHWNASRHCWG